MPIFCHDVKIMLMFLIASVQHYMVKHQTLPHPKSDEVLINGEKYVYSNVWK